MHFKRRRQTALISKHQCNFWNNLERASVYVPITALFFCFNSIFTIVCETGDFQLAQYLHIEVLY